MSAHDGFIATLEESIEFLQEDLNRHRRSNRMLRKINNALREQLSRAHENDEAFKEFCNDTTNVVEEGVDYLDLI